MRSIRGAGVVVLLLMAGWMAAAGRASGVDTNNPTLPPSSGDYFGERFIYGGPGLSVVVSNFQLHPFAAGTVRTLSGPDELEDFQVAINALVSANSSPNQPTTGLGQEVTRTFGKAGNTTGSFAAEMLTLNISGTSPFGPYMLRESRDFGLDGPDDDHRHRRGDVSHRQFL